MTMIGSRTADEFWTEWTLWTTADADSPIVQAYMEDGATDSESIIVNFMENLVADAIKAGIIDADWENSGWHEGWTRMGVKLNKMAEEFMAREVRWAVRGMDSASVSRMQKDSARYRTMCLLNAVLDGTYNSLIGRSHVVSDKTLAEFDKGVIRYLKAQGFLYATRDYL